MGKNTYIQDGKRMSIMPYFWKNKKINTIPVLLSSNLLLLLCQIQNTYYELLLLCVHLFQNIYGKKYEWCFYKMNFCVNPRLVSHYYV